MSLSIQDLRDVQACFVEQLVSRLEPAGSFDAADAWPRTDTRDFASATDNCMRPSCHFWVGVIFYYPRRSYIAAPCTDP